MSALEDVSDAEDVEELEDSSDFLQAATDVRYFGATLSFCPAKRGG